MSSSSGVLAAEVSSGSAPDTNKKKQRQGSRQRNARKTAEFFGDQLRADHAEGAAQYRAATSDPYGVEGDDDDGGPMTQKTSLEQNAPMAQKTQLDAVEGVLGTRWKTVTGADG